MTSTTRGGSRIALPPNALKVCASCRVGRGNVRTGWTPITAGGEVVGYTCPACPTHSEPIRREASGRFVAVVGIRTPEGQRRQLKRRFDRLDAARQWVAEVRTAGKAPGYADPSLWTVQQLADRWLNRRDTEVGTPGGIRRNTHSGYRSAMSSLLGILGDRVAREVTADDIEAALLTLATVGGKRGHPLAHRSIVYALTGVRQVFAYALRSGWVLADPAAIAKAPRKVTTADTEPDDPTNTRSAKRWTPAQLVTFRTYVDARPLDAEPWLRVGARLTLCGLRRSEVLGVDWTNVDHRTGRVRVVASRTKDGVSNTTTITGTKTDNSRRTVTAEVIHPGTAAALRELWLAQGRPSEGLVIRDSLGEPVQPDAYSRRFKTLCAGAGVPHLARIHNVRHSLATALQDAGVPDHQAAALLGHDVDTYRRFYLVTDDDAAADAAEVAGRLFAV
ncbi:tyrosine-type recombinase/integrase [Micropruina sp.]|uniref:tyrosine-type recombinase/integrase n=1 Tax=Micropruina sp. TaxID=2737536 RepID=UPI0039E6DDC6